jgi:protein gp37
MRQAPNGPLAEAATARHILWGVTVENRDTLKRLDDLRGTSVSWRFVSFEPLLEDLGEVDLRGIHWVIVGGESPQGSSFPKGMGRVPARPSRRCGSSVLL